MLDGTRAASRPPYVVGFFLVPSFPMMAFAAAIEPLRSANRLRDARLFAWRLHSRDGAPERRAGYSGASTPMRARPVSTR
jgi:transcriptional regulator GlxA family with amidase domain